MYDPKKRYTLLVIEDDLGIREAYTTLFGFDNFDVITAENGLVGLLMLERHPEVDVILLDFKMPIMTGREFLKAKEEHPNERVRTTPVLISSATRSEEKDVARSGVAFVRKPPDMANLIAQTKALL